MMIVGVTGSRFDRPESCVNALRIKLISIGASELHHGDCVGFDRQANNVARSLGIKTVSHPPNNHSFRANCQSDIILPEKPYLERNADIVMAVDFLIAAPDGPEKVRSGTWSTVRLAKRLNKRGVILSWL